MRPEQIQRRLDAFITEKEQKDPRAVEPVAMPTARATAPAVLPESVRLMRTYDQHQIEAVEVSYLCCRRTVYATNAAYGCLSCGVRP